MKKLAFLLITFIMPVSLSADNQSDIYQIKALFLYNFANFIEWPEGAFDSHSDPIRLCLFGDIPFGEFLDEVNGTLIGDRALNVFRSGKLSEIKAGCHILFVGEDKKVELPKFWNQIKYTYVLSIGEEKGFTDLGGIVNIMRTLDQVQFDINISNAKAGGLIIGSDILGLARKIKRNTLSK